MGGLEVVMQQNVIAMVFDFDDTLTEDSVNKLLSSKDIDLDTFWKQDVGKLVKDGWDPPLAYMKKLADLAKPEGRLFSLLTNSALAKFGDTLNFYDGIPEFFDETRQLVKNKAEELETEIGIDFYLITSGLQAIVDGSTKIRSHFKDVWGSSFDVNPDTGVIFPKNAITFTDKTRFLFQISKGKVGPYFRGKPDAVNEAMVLEDRPVPFRNMIYVGDGLTDIPCFSLVEDQGGIAFGIADPDKPESEERKKIAWNLLSAGRTKGVYPPKYSEGTSLRQVLDLAVDNYCQRISLRGKLAM